MAKDKVVVEITAKDSTKKGVDAATKSFSKMAKTIGPLVAAGFGIAAVKSVTDAYIRQEDAIAQLDARLKSTGNTVGFTSKQLQDMASSLQGVTKFGDEAIIEMQSLLLTFTKIGGETFPQATEAILNVSTAMGQDLQTSAIQVGKALNDPIAGLGSLSRSGIQFTDVQKDLITGMVEMGDTAGAQAIILQELETQFGGAARAAKETLGGALQSAENDIGDLAESIGGILAPTISELANTASFAARALREMIDPTLQGDIEDLKEEIQGIQNLLLDEEALNGEDSYIGRGLQKQIAEREVELGRLEQKLKDINSSAAIKGEAAPTEGVPTLSAKDQAAAVDDELDALAAQLANDEAIREVERQQLEEQNAYKLQLYEEDVQAKKTAEEQKIQYQQNAIDAGRQALGNLASLMNSESRKAFEIGKTAAIAQATINTYESATGAYKALSGILYVGPALGAAAAAAAIAAGIANVQSIQSTQFQGGGGGAPSVPNVTTGGQVIGPVIQPDGQFAQNQAQEPIKIEGNSLLAVLVEEQIIPALNEASSRGVQLVIV
jgi:hypothetical protein